MMFREPLDLPDEYDTPGVEPWSWRLAIIAQVAASLVLWSMIAASLFYFGVLSW